MSKVREDAQQAAPPRCVAGGIASLRLQLNPRLAIESKTDTGVVVFDFDSNARFQLTTAVYALLRKFETANRVGEVMSQYAVGEALAGVIANLLEKGILIEEGARQSPKESRLVANPRTLFNCPRWLAGAAAQVAVVGVPFDLGNTVAAGARSGPDAIRNASRQYDYRLDFLSGRPVGWFDLDTEERVLEGVSFADRGDLWFSYGENPETIYQRLASVCEEILSAGAFPCFLGGDHAITFPIVECLQRHAPLTVVWFDAHNDLGTIAAGAAHDHASVARRLLDLPNVSKIVQIGLKGYTIYNELTLGGERVISITASRLRRHGAASVLDLLPEAERLYISLDIDVLDPVYAPGTSTPVPGGLTPAELKELCLLIGRHRDVAGFDLVEVNPEKDHQQQTSQVACHLLLATLGAIFQRRAAQT